MYLHKSKVDKIWTTEHFPESWPIQQPKKQRVVYNFTRKRLSLEAAKIQQVVFVNGYNGRPSGEVAWTTPPAGRLRFPFLVLGYLGRLDVAGGWPIIVSWSWVELCDFTLDATRASWRPTRCCAYLRLGHEKTKKARKMNPEEETASFAKAVERAEGEPRRTGL